ncbi:50S ribosomal protein L2 [Candidatus Daviesbacteria bacterium]|nr:50S ribosomal protein L2 [Candidatus Daviesbacteria bacterium]
MKNLKTLLKKHSGRSTGGMVTVRGQGGRHKRYYREIDFKRDKFGVSGEIVSLDYDPNRNVGIALVKYADGEYRYILAPKGIAVGSEVISGEKVEIKDGNACKLKNITVGTLLHNVEMKPGKGGQLGRSAGTALQLLAKEGEFAHLKLPSGEIRMIPLESLATIGSLGNEEMRQRVIGKAGRSRHMGIRPTVRGVAQDPDSHPHGGGEGRSGIGRKTPMTKYGRPAVGKTRNKKKQTSRYIVKRRRP